MLKFSLPLRLAISILFTFVVYRFLSLEVKQFFFAISLSIKEILMIIIPFVVFSSVYKAFINVKNIGGYIIIILIICVISSNLFSLTLAGLFNYFFIYSRNIANISTEVANNVNNLQPLWNLTLPKFIPNNIALLSALLLGIFKLRFAEKYINKFAIISEYFTRIFLMRCFIPCLPIFIFGFLIKSINDDVFRSLKTYDSIIYLWMFLLLFIYLVLLLIAASFLYNISYKTIIKNTVASVITAFSTMSSSAALPFTIEAARKNTGNKIISDLVMPTTMNIHMIGDSICIPIMAVIILRTFGFAPPELYQYGIFIFAFIITKFSGAGLPSGSIIVMIPVLENNLGFTPEMIGLITTFYMITDPIITSANVIGNNLFVMYFNKLIIKLNIKV